MSNGRITDFLSGRSEECRDVIISGRMLKVETDRVLPLGASVKIEYDNQLWTGEVWACEPLASGFMIEIESSLVLNDLAALDKMASHFRRATAHVKTDEPVG